MIESIPNITLFYFSGTGNTKVVCGLLSDALQNSHQCSAALTSIESETLDSAMSRAESADLIGIAFPIYGLGAPKNIIEFSIQLASKLSKPKTFFILMTAGDFISINHSAAQTLIKSLEKHNHQVVYERIIAMGSNFAFPYDPYFNKQLYETAKLKTAHIATDLITGKKRRLSPSLWVRTLASVVHKAESDIGAGMYGKSLKSSADCNGCGLCVKTCPQKNLSLSETRVSGSDKCIICMRCVYICPKQALRSKGMQFVILREGYNLNTYINLPDSNHGFVLAGTKGYYKHFYAYLTEESL